jgi:hypothetical protein
VRTPFPNNNGGTLLSPSDGGGNIFARITRTTSYESPRRLWWWTAPAINGITRIDGNAVNGYKVGLDNNWHLVSLTLQDASAGDAQAFGTDRPGYVDSNTDFPPGFRCGGIAYAEVLIYDRTLSADEVKNVEAYLTAKWFRKGTPGVTVDGQIHNGEDITLGSDGTLVLDGVPLSAVNVSGAGTVMNAAVPPTVWQVHGPRVFDRGLILADGATVHVDFNGNALDANRIDVTGGLTVLGQGTFNFVSVSNWKTGGATFSLFAYDMLTDNNNWAIKWHGVNAPNGTIVKGAVDGTSNQLNAFFFPSGTVLMIR